MAENLVKVIWIEDAIEKRTTSQGGPLYLIVWDKRFGSGVFGVPPHKYLGRPGSHIGDEIYHVVSGTLWVLFPEFHTIKRVEQGQTLYMPARTTHAPYNHTDRETLVLTCSAPLNPEADVHYSMDLADIMRFMGEGRGQSEEEPKVFPLDGLVERGRKSRKPVFKRFVTGKTMTAGAFYIPPKQAYPRIVRRRIDSVWYVLKGKLTAEEKNSGKAVSVPKGKALYIAPGASVSVKNGGAGELVVYFASAVKK